MKRSNLFFLVFFLNLSLPTLSVWRLGKPLHLIPTIKELNTYTFSPLKTLPLPIETLDIRQLTALVQKQKGPQKTQLVIHEKDNEKEKIKTVKGYCTVTAGVPALKDEYITIACRGFALRKNPKNGLPQTGGGIIDGYSRLRNNLCHTPLVTFDFADQRRTFNFAQELDIACLKTVYDDVIAQNPHAKIILTGDCRGALAALKFAASNPTNLYALVLTSPFVSAQDVTNELAKHYLQRYLGKGSGKLLHNFFQWWFPNYDSAQDDLWQLLDKIKDKKIVIIHRTNDTMVADETVKDLANSLKKNNDVSLSIINDSSAKHAKLMQVSECQALINSFYMKNNISSHNLA